MRRRARAAGRHRRRRPWVRDPGLELLTTRPPKPLGLGFSVEGLVMKFFIFWKIYGG